MQSPALSGAHIRRNEIAVFSDRLTISPQTLSFAWMSVAESTLRVRLPFVAALRMVTDNDNDGETHRRFVLQETLAL